MKNFTEAAVTERAFNCPHCGVLTSHTWSNVYGIRMAGTNLPILPSQQALKLLRVANMDGTKGAAVANMEKTLLGKPTMEAAMAGNPDFRIGITWVSHCFVCKEFSIWIGEKLIYPAKVSGPEPNDDLNADIKADFEEARTILNASPRGSAALLRLCVQKLCKQLGEPGENINSDIASLVAKGLDVTIQQALDIVRVVGNEAVHPGALDLKDDRATALELFELINIIAEQRISMPNRVKAAYEKLPADKRGFIEARDKAKPGPK